MDKILSIPFNYFDKQVYSLVRVFKNSAENFELRVTIMDDDLKTSLGDNHTFLVKNGKLHVDVPSEERHIARVKLQIAEALNKYFDSHPLQ